MPSQWTCLVSWSGCLCTVKPGPWALHWSPEASALRGGGPTDGHAAETGSRSDHNQILQLREPLSRFVLPPSPGVARNWGNHLLHPFKRGTKSLYDILFHKTSLGTRPIPD